MRSLERRVRAVGLVALLAAGLCQAGERRFSLNLSASAGRGSLSAAQEAQLALWNDPMIRIRRAMDIEMGRILLGQPGGRTPPLFSVAVGGGQPPRVIRASFENNLARTTVPPPAIAWPWLEIEEPEQPSMEEQLGLLLGRRLEQKLGS